MTRRRVQIRDRSSDPQLRDFANALRAFLGLGPLYTSSEPRAERRPNFAQHRRRASAGASK